MKRACSYMAATLAAAVLLAIGEYQFPDLGLAYLFAVSPSLIAFGFAALDAERPLRSLGWRPNFPYWLTIAGVVGLLTAGLLGLAWWQGHTAWNASAFHKFLKLSTWVGLAVGIVMNTGEEAGWRGYLFPKLLMHWGWWPAILASTVVWWAWHVPFMAVLQVRQFGEVQWGTQAIQLLSLLPSTVLLSYWMLRSRSVWALGFAHQASNFVDKWFLGLEHAKKSPIFFADKSYAYLYSLENGVFGVLAVALAAAVVYHGNRQFCLKSRAA